MFPAEAVVLWALVDVKNGKVRTLKVPRAALI